MLVGLMLLLRIISLFILALGVRMLHLHLATMDILVQLLVWKIQGRVLHLMHLAPLAIHRGGSGSMVKRVLQSIFCMSKTMVKEVNEKQYKKGP